MPINSKKDLDKPTKCAKCGEIFPRKETRGTTDGQWLCVADWEDKHGTGAPPPVPTYKST